MLKGVHKEDKKMEKKGKGEKGNNNQK